MELRLCSIPLRQSVRCRSQCGRSKRAAQPSLTTITRAQSTELERYAFYVAELCFLDVVTHLKYVFGICIFSEGLHIIFINAVGETFHHDFVRKNVTVYPCRVTILQCNSGETN